MRAVVKIAEYVPLKQYSTFGIGGPARFLITVTSIDELYSALQEARKNSLPYLVIGNGSNCLFHDQGFCGLVIVNRISFITEGKDGWFQAGAGTSFPKLARTVSKKGWTGLEFGAGIPASVGGAVYMNAGASGQQIQDTLYSVDTMTRDGILKSYHKGDFSFGYRYSNFQGTDEIICFASFLTKPSETAFSLLQEKLQRRMDSQPYEDKSVGCIFKNPPNDSAGRLIEQAGLKGFSIGGALVSPKHANFIVNTGNATALDVRALAEEVVHAVWNKFTVRLETEVRMIGLDGRSLPLCGGYES